MSETLNCKRCDIWVDNPFIERIEASDGKLMLKAHCPKCMGYLKFLSPEPEKPAVFFVGKLKGLSAIEAIAKDRQYCLWAVDAGMAKGRLRRELINLLEAM